MIEEKLLDEVFDSLLEIDGVVDVPFVPNERPLSTNIQAPPTRDDRPMAVLIVKKRKMGEGEDEDQEIEEAPIPPPPYPGGKPGGIPEDEDEDEESEKALTPEDMQQIMFGEQEAPQPPPDAGMAAGLAEPGINDDVPEANVNQMSFDQTQLSDPGKALELKKIFSRLLALQNFLSSSSEEGLAVLKDYVTKSIELFRTVIDNLASYKPKIDDIIVLFYDFIEKAYSFMREYYKRKVQKSNIII